MQQIRLIHQSVQHSNKIRSIRQIRTAQIIRSIRTAQAIRSIRQIRTATTQSVKSVKSVQQQYNPLNPLNPYSNNTMELIYADETYKIRGAIINVYNTLGCGFLEPVYQEALEIEFERMGITYQREVELDIYYDGILLDKKYKADFVCYGKIIVELKAVSELDDGNRAQIRNYLKATGYKLGLLVNFGDANEVVIERRLN